MMHRDTCEFADTEALVSYLFDECEPTERRQIEEHLEQCSVCTAEIEALRGVRRELAAWSPPETVLGFRVVGQAEAPVRRTSRWVPRWAVPAAAALLLAASAAAVANLEVRYGPDGVVVRTGWGAPAGQGEIAGGDRTDSRSLSESAEFASAVEEPGRQTAGTPAAVRPTTADRDELLQLVGRMIADSEQRQQRELALRLTQLVQEIEAQRQADLVRVQQGLGRLEGVTGAEAARQRQMLNYLISVSQRQ